MIQCAPSGPPGASSSEGSFQKLCFSICERNRVLCSLFIVIVRLSVSLPGSYPPVPLVIFAVRREVPSAFRSTRIAIGGSNVRSHRNLYDCIFCDFEASHNEGSWR